MLNFQRIPKWDPLSNTFEAVEAYQNMYYRLDTNDEALQYRIGLNRLDHLEDDKAMEIFKHCAESTNSNPIKLCSLIQIVFIRLRCGGDTERLYDNLKYYFDEKFTNQNSNTFSMCLYRFACLIRNNKFIFSQAKAAIVNISSFCEIHAHACATLASLISNRIPR